MKHNKSTTKAVVSDDLTKGRLNRFDRMLPSRVTRHIHKKHLYIFLLLAISVVVAFVFLSRHKQKKIASSKNPDLTSQIEAMKMSHISDLPTTERYIQLKSLGRLYEQDSDYKQAQEAYIAASKLPLGKQDFTIWESLIRVTEKNRGSQKEIVDYAKNLINAIEANPNRMTADFLSLAEAKKLIGDKRGAIKSYEEFLAAAKFGDVKPDSNEPTDSNTFPYNIKNTVEQNVVSLRK